MAVLPSLNAATNADGKLRFVNEYLAYTNEHGDLYSGSAALRNVLAPYSGVPKSSDVLEVAVQPTETLVADNAANDGDGETDHMSDNRNDDVGNENENTVHSKKSNRSSML